MGDIFFMADVHGPRLTNSPGHRGAAEWAMKRLESYGLKMSTWKYGEPSARAGSSPTPRRTWSSPNTNP